MDENPILFHYTSQAGLLGIAQTGELWATKIQFLNDSKEFSLAFDSARSAIFAARKQADAATRNLILDYIHEYLDRFKELSIFVISFSEEGDLLSQWRAYSKGGIGYSVGFEIAYLRYIAERAGFRLEKCIYDLTAFDSLATQLVSKILSDYNKVFLNTDFNIEEFREEAARNITSIIAGIAPTAKHHAFHEEREWRLVGWVPSVDKRLFSRDGRIGLIPTYRMDVKGNDGYAQVSTLIQGPAPDSERAFSGLSSFSSSVGNLLKIRCIKPSTTPYRQT